MANILKNVQDLCSPALIFSILAIVVYILSYSKGYMQRTASIITPIVIIALTTFMMHKMCSSGYKMTAWVILIFLIVFAPSPVGIGFDVGIIYKLEEDEKWLEFTRVPNFNL